MEQMLHGGGEASLVKMLQKCFAKVPQYWSSFLEISRPTVLHCQAPYTRLQELGLGHRN